MITTAVSYKQCCRGKSTFSLEMPKIYIQGDMKRIRHGLYASQQPAQNQGMQIGGHGHLGTSQQIQQNSMATSDSK